MRLKIFRVLSFLALMVAGAADQVPLPLVSPMFGDNMVLQRGKPNAIWGWAKSGDTVRVEIAGRVAKTVAVTVGHAQSCIVDGNDVHQQIDGFGASSAWQSIWTTAQGDMFFSTNNGTGRSKNGTNFSFTGIGLSLLRTRIAPGATTVENSLMQMAQARGAKVWSSPWSPQASFKSNGNLNGGGFVGNTANYQAYANQLAGYVVNLKNTYGINLYALSVQNEPDAKVTTYESCNWTAQQIHDFIPYLYNALAASNVASTKIILPESQNWPDYSNLVATAMSDSTSNLVSIVADHNYDGKNGPASLVKNSYGKPLWETEVSLLSGSDSSITNGVYYAGRIHLFLTVAQANAWHYWWLMPGNSTGNQGLTDTNGVPAKRMFALGQFSRFVRPNYYRIGVANNTGVAQISAYKDSLSPSFAIVTINSTTSSINQTFTLTNFSSASIVTPWMTTSNLSLANQAAVAVTNLSFSYALPAMSIVTFAGQAINNQPTLVPISNKTINAGAMLLTTNVATDLDSPPQTLTFNLLNAPTNATLNSSNGIFSWRPLVG
jgi:glucuronoarabinoxylan endo-1,4-beta-xylanase